MNKKELIEMIMTSKDCPFESKASAERAVAAVLNGIKKGLKKDQSVQLIGFGSFIVKKRKAREGRNPQTGEKIKIKASRTIGFRPGKALKESIS
jgi:DNA-binding protein HU-beta